MRAFRPCSSRVSEVLFGALAVAGLLVAYGLLAGALARRWAFQASDRVHRLLPLPTPGHHAALVHHPPAGPARAAPPVIVCHGMAVNGLCMDALDDGHGSPRLSLARTLAAAGFDVWALELRGRGRAAVPRGARWTVDDEVGEGRPGGDRGGAGEHGRVRGLVGGPQQGGPRAVPLPGHGPRAGAAG